MTIKYNRALDLLCAAAEFQKAGQPLRAAKALASAVKDSSLASAFALVEAANSKAHAALTAAGFDADVGADDAGEELRETVKENGDRIVQESAADDDMDDEDSLEAAADDCEDDEVEKAEAALKAAKMKAARRSRASANTASASPEKRLAQALRNFDRLK
jgi:hypothetical protein